MKQRKRIVYITGATGGVGSALVTHLKQIDDRSVQICALQRGKIKLDEKYKAIKYDLLNPDYTDIYRWTNEQRNQYEIAEFILILCAGTITPIASMTKIDDMDLERHVAVNIKGQIFLIKRIAAEADEMDVPLRIIYLDSGAAYRPISGWGLYCSAKAYMSMYLQVLQEENPAYKIVLVDPGVIDTKMQKAIRNAPNKIFPDVEVFIKYKENGQLKTPEEVAERLAERYIYGWAANNIKEKLP